MKIKLTLAVVIVLLGTCIPHDIFSQEKSLKLGKVSAADFILPSTSVPQKWRWLLMLNPMSGIIEGYRAALFGLPFDWPALGIASALTIVVLLYAIYAFGRVERSFADII